MIPRNHALKIILNCSEHYAGTQRPANIIHHVTITVVGTKETITVVQAAAISDAQSRAQQMRESRLPGQCT